MAFPDGGEQGRYAVFVVGLKVVKEMSFVSYPASQQANWTHINISAAWNQITHDFSLSIVGRIVQQCSAIYVLVDLNVLEWNGSCFSSWSIYCASEFKVVGCSIFFVFFLSVENQHGHSLHLLHLSNFTYLCLERRLEIIEFAIFHLQ